MVMIHWRKLEGQKNVYFLICLGSLSLSLSNILWFFNQNCRKINIIHIINEILTNSRSLLRWTLNYFWKIRSFIFQINQRVGKNCHFHKIELIICFYFMVKSVDLLHTLFFWYLRYNIKCSSFFLLLIK